MSARIHWFALSIAIPLLVTTASNAAAGAWSLDPGEFYSQIHGSWFSSDTYYDQNGGRAFLHGGGLWEERSLVSYNELGWKPKLSFILGIPVKSVTRQMGGPEPHALATATGPADGLFGLRYRLANGRRAMALELDWIPPLSYERSRFLTHADSVAAGDSNGDGDSLDANAARQIGSPTLGDGVQNLALNFPVRALRSIAAFSRARADSSTASKSRPTRSSWVPTWGSGSRRACSWLAAIADSSRPRERGPPMSRSSIAWGPSCCIVSTSTWTCSSPPCIRPRGRTRSIPTRFSRGSRSSRPSSTGSRATWRRLASLSGRSPDGRSRD